MSMYNPIMKAILEKLYDECVCCDTDYIEDVVADVLDGMGFNLPQVNEIMDGGSSPLIYLKEHIIRTNCERIGVAVDVVNELCNTPTSIGLTGWCYSDFIHEVADRLTEIFEKRIGVKLDDDTFHSINAALRDALY